MQADPPTFAVGDKRDAFDVTLGWYYVMHIMLIIYGLGYIASLVLVQNVTLEHTYFKANVNGILHSERFVSLYWIAVLFSCMRLFVFITVCCLMLYRNSTCCGAKPGGCSVFWIIVLVALILADVMGFAILSSFYTRCNGVGQAGNPCNDLKWCCDPAIFGDASNLCSITAACTPALTLADMSANLDFIWLYSVSAGFIAFDLFFLMLPLALWIVTSSGGAGSSSGSDDAFLDETDIVAVPIASRIRKPMPRTRNTPQMLAAAEASRKMTKQP